MFAPHSGDARPGPFDRREVAWLIFDLNPAYLREVMLPAIVQRDLAAPIIRLR